jgi:rSAM/selenodomain-associated transferase 1
MPLPSLILFARAPEAGRVKTRLAPRLTEAGAAELYRAFLEDAARVYLDAGRWESVLCADPDPLGPELEALFPHPWVRRAQAGGDLGQRLTAAFLSEFRRGAPAAAAVGSDHPALPRRRLAELFENLASGSEAAVIPAEDGGYCAIGMTCVAPIEEVFRDIPWSTGAVLSETILRMKRVGLRYGVLDSAYDVDRPEDLDRLRRDLAERDAAAEDYPVATARALAALSGGRA